MMDRKLYCGIDGGGTKTKCIISYKDGRVIGTGISGPTNPNYYGFHKTVSNISKSIKNALKDANISDSSFESICMGLSGAGPKNRKKLTTILKELNLKHELPYAFRKVFVYGDSLIAWYGAFNGNPGIIVIAGTGHFVYGRNHNLDQSSAGLNIEDLLRGGSFHLGLFGMKIALEKFEKGKTNDILLRLIMKFFYAGKLWPKLKRYNIKDILLDSQLCFQRKNMKILKREDVASVARLVNAASVHGHHESKELIHRTVDVIINNILFVKSKIFTGNVDVAIIGSLFKAYIIKQKLRPTLRIIDQEINIIKPRNPPEIGALNMAIKNFKVSTHA